MRLEKTDRILKQFSSNIEKEKGIGSDPNLKSFYHYGEVYGDIDENDKVKHAILLNIFDSRVFTERTKMAVLSRAINVEECKSDIKDIFNELHDKEIPYVNIHTEHEEFFEKQDFVHTVYRKKYEFNFDAIKNKKIPISGKVKCGYWSDLIIQNGAAQLYEVPLHSNIERNTMNRPYWWWNLVQRIHPNRKLAVFFGRIGLPQSYMFFRQKGDTIVVEEMFATSGEGIQGLLGYLAQIGTPQTKYRIFMPVKSRLEDFFSEDEELSIEVIPHLMSRIIDFEKILSFMTPIYQKSFVVEVTDDNICPWNNNKWKVDFDDKKVKVIKTTEKPDYSGSISAWTKVLIGELSLGKAIKYGEIRGKKHPDNDFVKGTISFYENY